jgi:hypothetical protein
MDNVQNCDSYTKFLDSSGYLLGFVRGSSVVSNKLVNVYIEKNPWAFSPFCLTTWRAKLQDSLLL